MPAPKLTITEARTLDFEDLITRADDLVEQYAPPATETQEEKVARIEATLDHVPDLYRWFLTLESHFDHWTDAMKDQFGQSHPDYKAMRERRDAMERAASFAKMRYEGTSRELTRLLGFDPDSLPTTRRAMPT